MICLSVNAGDFGKCLLAARGFDLVELRLDDSCFTRAQYEALTSARAKIVVACRPGYKSRDERLKTLSTAIKAGASYIDVELGSDAAFLSEIRAIAGNAGARLIISYHNYDLTPPLETLSKAAESCFDKGADIVKIACAANSASDCARIMSLYGLFRDGNSNGRLIAIGMGQAGRISRVAAIFLGAPFTYASMGAGEETAEGQFSFAEIDRIIKAIERETIELR